ncbi:MAG: hypothetical protein ACPLYD_13380 [Anaerolineae bacterium]|jgi:hypothetical protein
MSRRYQDWLAKGDFTQSSDADVLVALRHPAKWETVYACSDGIVQPVVITGEKLIAQLEAKEPFLYEIIPEGTALLEAEGIYNGLRRRVSAAARRLGLERTPYGWMWSKSSH